VFTALFLISEGTADIEIRGLPVGGIIVAKRFFKKKLQEPKKKDLN
jgi:hypothetical protein